MSTLPFPIAEPSADALAAGVADWLVSRVRWDGGEAGLGAAHIDGVIPPDEYAEGDDSVR